ncbi:MAG: 6-bladed beta-propeller [Gemmatimonadota bacterium]|nr:6-bladed beta-propeller [Gemmatimonadota bacterium]
MRRRWMLLLPVALPLCLAPAPADGQRLWDQEIVWPLPPEEPRVRYVGWVATEADIGKSEGFLSNLRNRLSGTRSAVVGMQRPHDVHMDGGTRLFVSDGAKGKVVLFNLDTHEATVIGNGGVGNLRKPMGLGGDGAGTVYVSDASGSRVVAYDRDGQYLRAYGGEAILLNPTDVAVDTERDRLYVADSYLHQVVVFSVESGDLLGRIGKDVDDLAAKREALRGAWEGGIHAALPDAEIPEPASHAGTQPRDLVGNRGGEPGELRYPGFVAVAPDGTLYVTDQMNFRVQAFGPDGSFLRQIGSIGRTPGSFSRPKGVAVDSEGHLYVADALFNNVQVFDADGRLLLVFGRIGAGAGDLYLPLGMQVDGANRIYIADRYNNRIQIFQFLGTPRVADGEDPNRDR